MELKKGLENLGFLPSPFDPCVFVLPNEKSGTPEGLVGIHVDDGLCCGSEVFQEKLRQLSEKFPFGSHKRRNFTFTGLKIDQQPDQSIHIHQTQYIKEFITSLFHEIEEVNLMTLSLTLKDKNCEPSLGHCSMPPSIVALISAVASDDCNHESTGHKSLRCWRPIEHCTKQNFMLR